MFFFGMFFFFKFVLFKKYDLVEIIFSNYKNLVIDGEKEVWIVVVKGVGKVFLD